MQGVTTIGSLILRPVNLTSREAETLKRLMEGRSNKEIAAEMGISTSTVRTFIRILNVKIGESVLRCVRPAGGAGSAGKRPLRGAAHPNRPSRRKHL